MRRLGLFSSLDYVSTVSGGGYIGGWLQAVLANGIGLAALDLGDTEPREVRFLRGFSNYLTPKLGLFSGDTWAAVGVSLRNLILNFTILSLSLAVPLFLPWVVAILFWTVAAWHVSWGIASCLIVVVAAAVLLACRPSPARMNMARPDPGRQVDQERDVAAEGLHGLRDGRDPLARRRRAGQRRHVGAGVWGQPA